MSRKKLCILENTVHYIAAITSHTTYMNIHIFSLYLCVGESINMVLNSSTEVIRNIEWPQAPPPVLVVDTLLNTSFSVTVTLEEKHINIVSLYIEVCVFIGCRYIEVCL